MENPIEKILPAEEVKREDRLPLPLRNRFQIRVFKALIGEGLLDQDNSDETEKVSKLISEYIDNPKNAQERELILKERYDEAVEILMAEIRQGKIWTLAA